MATLRNIVNFHVTAVEQAFESAEMSGLYKLLTLYYSAFSNSIHAPLSDNIEIHRQRETLINNALLSNENMISFENRLQNFETET